MTLRYTDQESIPPTLQFTITGADVRILCQIRRLLTDSIHENPDLADDLIEQLDGVLRGFQPIGKLLGEGADEGHVIIPRYELRALEDARHGLWDIVDQLSISAPTLAAIQRHTGVMWQLANRKWPTANSVCATKEK